MKSVKPQNMCVRACYNMRDHSWGNTYPVLMHKQFEKTGHSQTRVDDMGTNVVVGPDNDT